MIETSLYIAVDKSVAHIVEYNFHESINFILDGKLEFHHFVLKTYLAVWPSLVPWQTFSFACYQVTLILLIFFPDGKMCDKSQRQILFQRHSAQANSPLIKLCYEKYFIFLGNWVLTRLKLDEIRSLSEKVSIMINEKSHIDMCLHRHSVPRIQKYFSKNSFMLEWPVGNVRKPKTSVFLMEISLNTGNVQGRMGCL